MALVFLDTNVLVYAYDQRDMTKYRVATKLLNQLFSNDQADTGVISTQVIQEFCNVALAKIKQMDPIYLGQTIDTVFAPLLAHIPDPGFYKRAIHIHAKHSLSFYDSLIIQAALDLNCITLYSEDLQPGQTFGNLTISNPFQKPVHS